MSKFRNKLVSIIFFSQLAVLVFILSSQFSEFQGADRCWIYVQCTVMLTYYYTE